jgi:hypothetical protein
MAWEKGKGVNREERACAVEWRRGRCGGDTYQQVVINPLGVVE